MTDFQREVARAQAEAERYHGWLAAQETAAQQQRYPAPTAEDIARDQEQRRQKRAAEVLPAVRALTSLSDPVARLLAAMTAMRSSPGVPEFGGSSHPDSLLAGWEHELVSIAPDVSPKYDSAEVTRWFVQRAIEQDVDAVEFTPLISRKKLFGGYRTVPEEPSPAWEFPRAVPQQTRWGRAPASSLFVLEDCRLLARRPLSAAGVEGPSIVISDLPPVVLKEMGIALGLAAD